VIVFVHGGAWQSGDRNTPLDVYGKLGRRLVARGILTVVPSYRLAPEFRHPEAVRDVARAIAWTFAHIERFGGDPRRVFLMGHSAGAHLVALAATDARWLRAEGIDTRSLAGVIAISGPYDIALMSASGAHFFARDLAASTFGSPEVYADASPIAHLGKSPTPPFLLVVGENDPESLRTQHTRFEAALRSAHLRVRGFLARGRNHFSILFRLGEAGDALGNAIVRFVGV
jgi:acetyl esterase/lipase